MTTGHAAPRKIHEGDADVVRVQKAGRHDTPVLLGPANIYDTDGPTLLVDGFDHLQ
jgi:hypothetical protein